VETSDQVATAHRVETSDQVATAYRVRTADQVEVFLAERAEALPGDHEIQTLAAQAAYQV
jgi:hypothetical protein